MSCPSGLCLVFAIVLIFFVVPKTDALVINYFDVPNSSTLNSSLPQWLNMRNYKREIPAGFADYGVGAYKFHKEPLTWGKAKKVCEGEGAHLAIINSQQEEEVLMAMFSKVPAAEIKGASSPDFVSVGVHDYFNEGEFETVDGKPLESTGFVHWQAGEPNGGNKENVLVIHRTGTLHDTTSISVWAYICEFDTYIDN